MLYKTAVLVGACVVFLGPREMPRLGRMLGYGLGRSVSALGRARTALAKVVDDGELNDVRAEIQRDLRELRQIQQEIRSAPGFHDFVSGESAQPSSGPKSSPDLAQNNSNVGNTVVAADESAVSNRETRVGNAVAPSNSASAQHSASSDDQEKAELAKRINLILAEFPDGTSIGLDFTQCDPELQMKIEEERVRQAREKRLSEEEKK